ncbi:hypothetical protein L484_003578 [Morus notabilis]|uniref:CCAAT-binding factor domain-containing protein n=1 Tax=Morus notabilis TaxID=981085 RepID=W9S3Z0_9ROSA|nr:hypothetical protein L484_003578 [Morus notabilis]
MAVSKSKKSSTDPEDLELLKTDVASFASSLGLSSSLPSSGFNDVDFRKTGPLPPTRPQKKQKQSPAAKSTESQNPRDRNSRPGEKPKPKPPVLSLDNGNGDKHLGFEKFKNMPKLPLMKASALGVWYADQAELETKVVGKEKKVEARNLNEWKSFVEKKRELGERLMAQYAKDYESSRGQSGDIKMLYATQRSGTVTDKVSAFSVLVGDNPVANLRSLDALLGMVSSKVGKRHALTGFEALKELFISSLLPDRMLKSLLQRPLNHLPETKDGYSLLLFWYWEECLKQRYERYIFALEEASRDMLPVLKNKAVKIIETLLKSKSEQERRLLSALVNKLGDPENKGASNADFHLSELLRDHPNMTAEMFIGLLLKAMKSDVNLKRVAAFAKRVMQVALQQPPQYACGCLFLLSEVLKTRPHLGKMVLQSESADEEDEHFEDIVEEADDRPGSASGKQETDGEPVENGGAATPDGDSSEDDDETPVPASEDEASDEADEFLVRDDAEDVNEAKTMSGSSGKQSQASSKKSSLPGGYDPQHREPSYCNADRVSWWELTALASHVHPSVSNMANRLLKGSDIIYDGNPLNDLSLTAFLDKFMEKKPKSSTWHGGSQIEPARKLEMSNHLIGPEILSLADEDVPPEDLVFHKFYVNKVNSSKKQKKKKKKGADDETAEELFGAGGDDESDNEEIENMLDSANISTNADGDYDYDDLDIVAEEDDEELVGNVSDAEDADIPSDIAEEEDFDATANENDDDDEDSDIINIGDADDDGFEQRRRKRKPGKSGVSPFASLDDYEHLLNEDVPPEEEPAKKKSKKSKSRRKKSSD